MVIKLCCEFQFTAATHDNMVKEEEEEWCGVVGCVYLGRVYLVISLYWIVLVLFPACALCAGNNNRVCGIVFVLFPSCALCAGNNNRVCGIVFVFVHVTLVITLCAVCGIVFVLYRIFFYCGFSCLYTGSLFLTSHL